MTDWIGGIERLYHAFRRRSDIVSYLLPRLQGATHILDFGGGDGRISKSLAARMGGHFVVADIDACSLARVPPPLEPVLVSERGLLPFRDSSFDRVFLVDVLHHVAAPERAFAELRRCLRPDGILVVVEYDGDRGMVDFLSAVSRITGHECRFRSPDGLEVELHTSGFQVQIARLDTLRFAAEGRQIAQVEGVSPLPNP